MPLACCAIPLACLVAVDHLDRGRSCFLHEPVEPLRGQLAGAAAGPHRIEVRFRFERAAAERDLSLQAVPVRRAARPHRAVGGDRVGGEPSERVLHPHPPFHEETVDIRNMAHRRHLADHVGPQAVQIKHDDRAPRHRMSRRRIDRHDLLIADRLDRFAVRNADDELPVIIRRVKIIDAQVQSSRIARLPTPRTPHEEGLAITDPPHQAETRRRTGSGSRQRKIQFGNLVVVEKGPFGADGRRFVVFPLGRVANGDRPVRMDRQSLPRRDVDPRIGENKVPRHDQDRGVLARFGSGQLGKGRRGRRRAEGD